MSDAVDAGGDRDLAVPPAVRIGRPEPLGGVVHGAYRAGHVDQNLIALLRARSTTEPRRIGRANRPPSMASSTRGH